MYRILLVEDAETLREVITSLLKNDGFEVHEFAEAEPALEELRRSSYDCVLSDFRLPKMDGIEFLKGVREVAPRVPFLIMTAYGSIEIAVEAMKHGANDFICKPFEPDKLSAVLRQVIEHKRIIDRSIGTHGRRERTFLTQDPGLDKLLHQARKVAAVDSSVLILGESGTGKELMARYIHEHSPRSNKSFVAINCAAMPSELLESELFGHESGSFTGATQTRTGVFEVASEGTIFLDEIGDMPHQLQVKLLRALQEREIKRVGSNKVIKINPRVIAATNRDIDQALELGRVREDLYYRLAVVQFNIPPLRTRSADIDLLCTFFLDYFGSKLGKVLEIDETAMDFLKRYSWPGNTRELENVIERAAILADDVITPDHLGIGIDIDFGLLDEAAKTLTEVADLAAKQAEIEFIRKVLGRTSGNKSKAAQLLGVSYKTLLNKVKEYGLNAPEFKI